MKLWIDDVRPSPNPKEWRWIKSVNNAKRFIKRFEKNRDVIFKHFGEDVPNHIKDKWICEVIDIDHDAGDYVDDGGDYVKLLDWLEETGRNYPLHLHSMNPVGVENMRRIIQRNGWKEII